MHVRLRPDCQPLPHDMDRRLAAPPETTKSSVGAFCGFPAFPRPDGFLPATVGFLLGVQVPQHATARDLRPELSGRGISNTILEPERAGMGCASKVLSQDPQGRNLRPVTSHRSTARRGSGRQRSHYLPDQRQRLSPFKSRINSSSPQTARCAQVSASATFRLSSGSYSFEFAFSK